MDINYTLLGLIIGTVLTFAAIFGGFLGFFLALVFVGGFLALGLHLDGKINLAALFDRIGGRS